MPRPKGQGKTPGSGRKKGTPNKTTQLFKDAIALAAENVGNQLQPGRGIVGYLEHQAINEPKSFMSLIGRTIPMQVEGTDNAIQIHITKTVVDAKKGGK